MMVLLSHITGNPNSRQAALCLAEHELLAEVHTTIAGRLFQKRAFPPQVADRVKGHPGWEILRLLLRGGYFERWCSIGQVAGRFDKAVAKVVSRAKGLKAVYGYMDASEKTFRAAKQRGLKTIYELPTPYWRHTEQIVREEALLEPAWAATLPAIEADSPRMRQRDEELRLADVVVVPSAAVRDSLRGVRDDVEVVPYGCPESSAGRAPRSTSGPLKVLYAGTLSQAKGLSYLAAAAEQLGPRIELTLAGRAQDGAGVEALRAFTSGHRWLGQLSHAALLEEMDRQHVLVLPTLLEGLSLVAMEAFSRGLPVITTRNSGLEGMMRDGIEGFFVPERDVRALVSCMDRLAAEPQRVEIMGDAALQLAARCSWAEYRNRLGKVVAECLK